MRRPKTELEIDARRTGNRTIYRVAHHLARVALQPPEDPKRLDRMYLKLAEYQLRRERYDQPRQVPLDSFFEREQMAFANAAAKETLLETMLQNEDRTVAEVWEGFRERDFSTGVRLMITREDVVTQYVRAADVIIDYVQTGGQRSSGGTLPDF